jgi:hypothetical protein
LKKKKITYREEKGRGGEILFPVAAVSKLSAAVLPMPGKHFRIEYMQKRP